MSWSRTSRRCSSDLAADNDGAKATALLELGDTYIDTKVVKDAELLLRSEKARLLILLLGLGLSKYPLLFCFHLADGI